MKKPTLEEVKEYFKYAEKIRCLYNSKEVSIVENITSEIYGEENDYWIDSNTHEGNGILLYDKCKYAEIITYKNLKIDTWYKSKLTPTTIINCQIFTENEKGGYGFHMGYYSQNWGLLNFQDYVEATQEEVFEALKKEAVKRGYVKGAKIKCPIYISENYTGIVNGDFYWAEGSDCLTVSCKETNRPNPNFPLFWKGVWAEIIEQPKEEKKPRPNRLEELEKRLHILELKVDSKKISEMPDNPYKSVFDTYPLIDIENGVFDTSWLGKEAHELKNPNFGIKVPEYLKNLENVKFGIDFGGDYHEISKTIDFNAPIPDYTKGGKFKGEGKIINDNWLEKINNAFDEMDKNPNIEINILKLRIEELEAENKVILGGGQSKLEKENEELKKELSEYKKELQTVCDKYVNLFIEHNNLNWHK